MSIADGGELQKLSTPACLTPKDKADVLVHAHKIAVDGLARLPSIELRPEGEPYVPEAREDEGLDTITEMAETPAETPAVTLSDPYGEGTELTEVVAEQPPETEAAAESEPVASEMEKAPSFESNIEEASAPSETADTPPRPATSGADLILPLIIFAVVKANPAQLASQLMYLRRYRSAISLAGEASYAIVNLTAVVEFLEHVQLSELGLGSAKVMSVDDLSPIGLADLAGNTESIASASSRLRGRVFTVSELAGSAADGASKVLTVVDSGISALRGFMSPAPADDVQPTVGQTRPRGASSFSLASVTASVANIAAAASTAAARTRSRASSHGEIAHGQELLEVAPGAYDGEASASGSDSDEREAHQSGEQEERHTGATVASPVDEHPAPGSGGRASRARSIVSVSSMMRDSSREREGEREGVGARLSSIGARLAESNGTGTPAERPVPGGGGLEKRGVGKDGANAGFFGSLSRRRMPRSSSATQLALDDAPMERFMSCEVGDIRLNEVGVLLRDYRRLAGVVARLQGQQ